MSAVEPAPANVARRSLRVVWVTPDFSPRTSGYANAVTTIVGALTRRNPELAITVVTPRSSADLPVRERLENGIEIRRFDPRLMMPLYLRAGVAVAMLLTRVQLRLRRRLLADLMPNDVDLVVCETLEPGAVAGALAELRHVPLMVRIHGTQETEHAIFRTDTSYRHLRWIGQQTLERAALISATSAYHVRFVHERYFEGRYDLIFRHRYAVLPNIVELPPDVHALSQQAARLELNQSSEDVIVLQLGRMTREGIDQKGFEDTLTAFRVLRDRELGSLGRMRLMLVGSGDREPALRAVVRAYLLDDVVEFLGPMERSRVLRWIVAADLVVMPSRYEGHSMFAAEVAALGTPMVLSSAGGLETMSAAGIVVNPFDPLDLAKALRRGREDATLEVSADQGRASATDDASDICAAFEAAMELAASSRRLE